VCALLEIESFFAYNEYVIILSIFMYTDVRNMPHEQKVKIKRQLTMQKMSYDSDLKKNNRGQEELTDELRRLEQDRSRVTVYIDENTEKTKKLKEKEDFLNEELRHIKKQLIELG